MRRIVGSSYKLVLPTVLVTYYLTLFLHTSGLLDFGAPNHGRHNIACSWRRGGRHPGGIPLVLEGWCLRPQHVGVEEAWLRLPRCLTGVSVANKAGF